MKSSYLSSSIKQFEYYKSLGDKTIHQLSFEELQWQPNEGANSISILVKHIVGNMLSRWTNFLTEDGEKEWRNRDAEFEESFTTKEQLVASWESGWYCLFNAIKPLKPEDKEALIYIRNQGHTVTEAINRQLTHYAYHIGQMVFLGKLLKAEKWQSLSIAKGKSNSYNQEKFTQKKEKKHFTDNL
ncbi:DUF1572 domain-containing protein [Lacinutrix sp. C3R15]|uniref:DUF1572 family protein n=1 Tax=Flavobacteriaceae TaxID=49546 RepID=UPI001C0A5A5C|nr:MULTISPECIES: DUF1572 family protein [Flavobacteriaceae]MBU2940317.1 DUF1572 domain-containing protein [Lacinutrix sp. C3R15]MDO6623637.1 DUF1572 family protein [Oceanihabitans sp. 1_MG-2023]